MISRIQYSICSFYLLLLLLISGIGVSGHGQTPVSLDSIAFHASELVRNQNLADRENSFEFLNLHLGGFLTQYPEYTDTFPRLEGLAVLENSQLRLRIVTYQLYRDTSTYVYGGWVQNDQLDQPVYLSDASEMWESDSDLDYMEMDPDSWYGALYYEMKPLSVSEDGMIILLFGLDNFHFFTKRKILETLVISDGEVSFGQSVVSMEAELPRDYWKKRFILDYSVQAPASLRYDEERKKIIFDHLIFMPSDITAQKIMRVPDGTYSGFEIVEEEQKLIFIEKVFSESMDEAPDGRAESQEKRDLFGNPIDDR